MNKTQLLEKLKKELSFLPTDELESRLAFYSEMIDDRIEEGLREEEAVAAIGDADEIISQLKSDYRPAKTADPQNPYSRKKEEKTEKQEPEHSPKKDIKQDPIQKAGRNKLSAWAIVLIVLGSPLWISLGAAAFVILLSTYIVIWAGAGSLWSLPVSLCGVSLGGIALGVVTIVYGNAFLGIALIGAAITCAGLSIFAGFGCFHLTRLTVFITKSITKGIIRLFKRKEKINA